MQSVQVLTVRPTVVLSLAVTLFNLSAAFGDVVPLTRTTTLSTSWFQSSGGGPPSTGGASDSFSTFGSYSNTIDANTPIQFFSHVTASQTSYLITNGAYAQVSGEGVQNTSVMQPAYGTGASTFVYTFNLTTPTTLYFTGSLSRGSPFVNLGTVRLFDNATSTQLYAPSLAGFGQFDLARNFADSISLAAGVYRLEVRAVGEGPGAGAPGGFSAAQVLMTVPGPGAASLLAIAAAGLRRRRRA